MAKTLKYSLAAICCAIFFTIVIPSCIDKDYDLNKLSESMEFNPKVAIQIGYTEIVLKDLLEKYDTTLKEYPDGYLYIVANEELTKIDYASGIFKIDPVQANFTIPIIPPAGTTTLSDTINTDKDRAVNTLTLKQVQVQVRVVSRFLHSGYVTISLPLYRSNGDTVKHTFHPGANGLFDSTYTETLSNADIKFKMDLESANRATSFDLKSVRFSGWNGYIGAEGMDINISLAHPTAADGKLEYSFFQGFLGLDTVVNYTFSKPLEIFNNPMVKGIKLADPKISVYIKNSFGMPIQYKTIRMDVVSNTTNQTYPAIFRNLPGQDSIKPKNIKHSNNKNNLLAYDSVVFTKQNTTVFDLLQDVPNPSLNCQFVGICNPYGYGYNSSEIIDTVNYICDTSNLASSFQMLVPIYLSSSGFSNYDTMSLDMAGFLGDNQEIESMLLRLKTESTLPIDISLQAYFADALYHKLDSFYRSDDNNLVKAATPDSPGGKVTKPSKKISDIVLTADQLTVLKNTKNLMISLRMNTLKQNDTYQEVKFYSDYGLKIKIFVQIKAKIKIN
jgi:hypothetical protein